MQEIESLRKEYEELLKQLSDPELLSNWDRFQELSKRKNSLEKIFDIEKEISENQNRIKENQSIITAKEDRDLVSLAETEIAQLQERDIKLRADLENSLESGQEDSEKKTDIGNMAAIIEIRAGTGGQEAALFVGDLYRMYSRYAQIQGWKQKTLDSNSTELGGFKEIVFELNNGNVFEKNNCSLKLLMSSFSNRFCIPNP